MNPSRGFTMVEMIVVLVVMGILASVALPRLMDRQALHERGFRDQLQGMLRDARRVAVTQQRDVCVQRAVGNPQQVEARYGAACNGLPLSEPSTNQAYQLALPNGSTWGGAQQVRFNALGQPVPNVDHVLNIGTGTVVVARETGFAYQP